MKQQHEIDDEEMNLLINAPVGEPCISAGCQHAEIERLKAVNERDRSAVAAGVSNIKNVIRSREWLRLGRGSYEYDDDRWMDEFGQAIDEIVEARAPLRTVAADWSDCPTTPEAIRAARSDSATGDSE